MLSRERLLYFGWLGILLQMVSVQNGSQPHDWASGGHIDFCGQVLVAAATPRREPQVAVPPLGTDLADTMGQAQGDDLSIPDHTDNVPGSSSQSTKVRSSDGHPVTSHLAVDAKGNSRVRGQNGALDGGDDGLEVESQVVPTALTNDTVLEALISGTAEEGLAPAHAKGKRHRSHRTEEEKALRRQRR
ncbi:hypothetical protein H5410_060920 [Solanum commersonii]|uniref:Uncharacterized protein n=1 Tax=Solanum commersonii TaxID=4109 RepID=A0A9J5W6J2_SOLCO|nr:hypothetical protein H5410_060920 [Solanum commersonii]